MNKVISTPTAKCIVFWSDFQRDVLQSEGTSGARDGFHSFLGTSHFWVLAATRLAVHPSPAPSPSSGNSRAIWVDADAFCTSARSARRSPSGEHQSRNFLVEVTFTQFWYKLKIQYSITKEFRKISVVRAKLYGDKKKKKQQTHRENTLGEKQENLFKHIKSLSKICNVCHKSSFQKRNLQFNIFTVFALILLEKSHIDKY